MNFDQIKARLIQYLQQLRNRQKMEELSETLHEKATIEYLDNSLTPIEPVLVSPEISR
jgi:hypothetical protein